MRYIVQLSPMVELTRLQEIAASPLCHSDKVFERLPGEHWLETSENLYRLIVTPNGFVVGAAAKKRPCVEFRDLLETLGVKAHIKKQYEEGEEPETDWTDIVERYGLAEQIERRHVVKPVGDLTPTEEEAFRAIQLLASSSEGWIDVGLFAHGFAKNLSTTLHSLARKGLITYSRSQQLVRLR